MSKIVKILVTAMGQLYYCFQIRLMRRINSQLTVRLILFLIIYGVEQIRTRAFQYSHL